MTAPAPPPRPRAVVGRALGELVSTTVSAPLSRVPSTPRVDGDSAVLVSGITQDSRAVRPGDVYAALPGARAHGLDFLDDARASGAVALLTDRPGPHPLPAVVVDAPRWLLGPLAAELYGRPSEHLDVVGITGTNGKTTSAYLVDAAFTAEGRTTGLVGTVETRVAGESLDAAHTTPEAPDLQALLALMRERDVTGVAMEVSSHGLAQGRVEGTHFAAAVFTNLSQDHLDFHPTMEDYFDAKATLFEPGRAGVAVVNVDDPWGRRLVSRVEIPLVTTSALGDPAADVRALDVAADVSGTTFAVEGAGFRRTARLHLPGSYNVDNALGVIAALTAIGVDVDAVLTGLAGLAGVPGRVERVDAGQPFLAVVDYAHSPDAVATVLAALRPLTSGRVLVVLGCGGDRDRAKRPLMGAAAAAGADVVVITSDNPRSEDPLAIVAAVVDGARAAGAGAEVLVEPDRTRAIELAVQSAEPGDVLLVAGKGHEQGQTFADRTIAFDDRVVLRAALEGVRR